VLAVVNGLLVSIADSDPTKKCASNRRPNPS
jgi:hypothetical protein